MTRLFSGDGAAFYQYVERDYKGVKSTPWEGGKYGFVRDPTDTAGGVVYTRFHEGIDIRPLHRDANGDPLDEVRAIADGRVVHTNLVPGYSNYGKYVVIEHHWDGSNYYSLYGHLSSIAVQSGEMVKRGQRIAVMGYTGTGTKPGTCASPFGIGPDVQPSVRSVVRHIFQKRSKSAMAFTTA